MSNQREYITLNCCNCGRHLAEKKVSNEGKQWGGIKITCHTCKTVNVFGTEKEVTTEPYGERQRYSRKSA